jgi:hypothetical protein
MPFFPFSGMTLLFRLIRSRLGAEVALDFPYRDPHDMDRVAEDIGGRFSPFEALASTLALLRHVNVPAAESNSISFMRHLTG